MSEREDSSNQPVSQPTSQPTSSLSAALIEFIVPSPLKFLMSNIKQIVTIQLNNKTYAICRLQILQLFTANGFKGYLTGSRSKPVETSADYKLWRLIDHNFISALFLTISPSILPYILNLCPGPDLFDRIYIILDLCPGPDLFDRIASHGSFYENEAAAIITQLAESIAECHRRGIAHRDIKPENILFGSNGRLLLADYGCAALFEKGERSLKGKVGTAAYAAPEVLAGETYNEKMDVVLYLLLGWTLPFNAESVEEIVAAVKKGDPVRFPKEFFPCLSPGAKDLIEQMLARDPAKRLSAEQVLSHPWITEMSMT